MTKFRDLDANLKNDDKSTTHYVLQITKDKLK